MEKEIKIVNKIIREAIIHGADLGGSYRQNEENLVNAISEWLELKGLSDKYVVKDNIDVGDGWNLHQIVKR